MFLRFLRMGLWSSHHIPMEGLGSLPCSFVQCHYRTNGDVGEINDLRVEYGNIMPVV